GEGPGGHRRGRQHLSGRIPVCGRYRSEHTGERVVRSPRRVALADADGSAAHRDGRRHHPDPARRGPAPGAARDRGAPHPGRGSRALRGSLASSLGVPASRYPVSALRPDGTDAHSAGQAAVLVPRVSAPVTAHLPVHPRRQQAATAAVPSNRDVRGSSGPVRSSAIEQESIGDVSEHISITLNGAPTTLEAGTTGTALFADSASTVVMRVDGEVWDLARQIPAVAEVQPVSISEPEGLDVLRHSTAHVMAQAVQQLFPDAKLGIGPYITDGFYFDFDVASPFTPDDLKKIEKAMQKIINQNQTFEREVVD